MYSNQDEILVLHLHVRKGVCHRNNAIRADHLENAPEPSQLTARHFLRDNAEQNT